MRPLTLVAAPAAALFVAACGGSPPPPGPASYAVSGQLTLPSAVAGRCARVGLDLDGDPGNGFALRGDGTPLIFTGPASGGTFTFSLADVPAGSYFLSAAVDVNGDASDPGSGCAFTGEPGPGDFLAWLGGTGATPPGAPTLQVPPGATGLSLGLDTLPAPRIAVFPPWLFFDPAPVGATRDLSFDVTNVGGADLHLGTIGSGDPVAAPYSVASDGCSGQTLPPSSSCTVSVRFEPGGFGASTDSLDVPSDDLLEPAVTVPVDGAAGPAFAGHGGGTWRTYRPVTVDYPAGEPALYDHQVLVAIMGRFDGGADLRVTDATGATELPFWAEAGWDTGTMAYTYVWVRVPEVPPGGTSLRVWFGNGSALPAADGQATFEIFDDFEDGVVDGSTWDVPPGVTAVEEGGFLKLSNGGGSVAFVTTAAYPEVMARASTRARLAASTGGGDPAFGVLVHGGTRMVLTGGAADTFDCNAGAPSGFPMSVGGGVDPGRPFLLANDGSMGGGPTYWAMDLLLGAGYFSGVCPASFTAARHGMLVAPGTEAWFEDFRIARYAARQPYANVPLSVTALW